LFFFLHEIKPMAETGEVTELLFQAFDDDRPGSAA
jgi:hypothetical protein